MARKILMAMALVVGGLLLTVRGATVSACCDWTPKDVEFWDRMSQNPQKFSYDMGARLTHFRIRNGGEEEVLSPAAAQDDNLWRHVLHHLNQKHGAASGQKVNTGAR